MKKILILFLLLTTISSIGYSQRARWKRTRYEAVGGLGLTGFMGDLGGGSVSSKHIGDFNFLAQRPVIQVGMRYKILEPLAVKSTLSYGWVSGADHRSKNEYNLNRNLKFYSPIVELAGQLEYSIVKEPLNHRYSLRRRRKFSFKNYRINTYLFAGVAGFWYNPKGKDDGPGGSGKWVALQPIGTEGQGLMESREKYKRVSMAFPMGIGFKHLVNRKISIGFEFGFRYTLTDYIDDVSTSYVDNDWIREAKGDQAARLADPSLWSDNPLPGFQGYAPGDQRGNAMRNDFYFFSMVTIAYKLRTSRGGLPKF